LLGAHFETYEPFISLIFKFVSCRSKLQITEAADTESEDTEARLYRDFTVWEETEGSVPVRTVVYFKAYPSTECRD
jgi:phage/plasmid-associated DNA primase